MSTQFNLSFRLILISVLLAQFAFAQAPIPSTIYAVQIGAVKNPAISDYDAIKQFGYLFSEQAGKGLSRVLIGRFSSRTAAENVLKGVKGKGFSGAFIRQIDIGKASPKKMIILETFAWEESINWSKFQPFSEIYGMSLNDVIHIAVPETAANSALAKKAGFSSIKQESYPEAAMHMISDFERSSSRFFSEGSAPLGKIFGPRPSVLALQEILKRNYVFAGTEDGKFGPETELAFDDYSRGERRYANYLVISKSKYSTPEKQSQSLQDVVLTLDKTPKEGAEKLTKFPNPMAKVYLSYLLITERVRVEDQANTINSLMKQAKSEIFSKYTGVPGFNVGRDYEYKDLVMFFDHFAAMHFAASKAPDLPCWLIVKHQEQIKSAFKLNTDGAAKISTTCDPLIKWPALQVAYEAAWDLSPVPAYEQRGDLIQLLSTYRDRRLTVFLTPERLSGSEYDQLSLWEKRLSSSISEWASKDPLNRIVGDVFLAAYYRSMIHLEDHFAANFPLGSQEEAHGMAVRVLQTMLELPLNHYLK